MGDMADQLDDEMFRQEYPLTWPDEGVSESMQRQEAIQKKIEAFEKIDQDVRDNIKPF